MDILDKVKSFLSVPEKEADIAHRKRRGALAKEFLESDFVREYLLPYVETTRMGGYPDPGKQGWEREYRTAYAKDEVYTALFSTIKGWKEEAEDLIKQENEPEKDIIDA